MLTFFKRLIGGLFKLVFALVLLVLVAGGTIFAVTGYSAYRDAIAERPVTEAIAAVQAQADFTPLAEIPAVYQNAVVAVEDHRFYSHHGLDVIGTTRAIVRNALSGELAEGGSSITQQLAKNLYFSQEASLTRKIAEFLVARDIEKAYSKDEILEAYINCIYYGDGYYTIAAASWGYFGVPPSALTNGQATLLAGVPNAPSVYAPTVNFDLARQRQQHVLQAMVDNDMLSAADAEAIYASGI